MTNNVVLACEGLSRVYQDGRRQISVLTGLDFSLVAGERVAIVGRSGSGKSTLLNLLGGLDTPTAGRVVIAGKPLSSLSDQALCQWRNQHLGFVFQFHHLLPEFTARESIAMPAQIGGMNTKQALKKADAWLDKIGLTNRAGHRPAQLSGGERQRVAIARALINQPSCVLMDEPTGNLDPDAAAGILALIDELADQQTAFVVVTHDLSIARRFDRTLELTGGALHPSP